jgi:hypothetical protein
MNASPSSLRVRLLTEAVRHVALALTTDGSALVRWRFLLKGAGVGAEGQDVSKSDAPVDYIGEAGQLHDLRDDASPGL